MDSVFAGYGETSVIQNISIKVFQSEIVSIIGGNGAGKSTLLRAASGMIQIKSGDIVYKNNSITSLYSHQLPKLGISHVPEGRRIFSRLTVFENLEMGAYTIKDKNQITQNLEYVFELFPILAERKNQFGGTLSGGEQQMLAIGRALMCNPALLLLDEPSMGVAPKLVEKIFLSLKQLNSSGTTILIVEQNANAALSLSTRGYVLELGNVILENRSDILKNDPCVVSTYLGG